ncbi:MAG: hypothetical protein JWO67_6893 [Streptosporangiaceae bacterium]|nr:hypothetical protein [Streptosporangiaceae bacterium]
MPTDNELENRHRAGPHRPSDEGDAVTPDPTPWDGDTHVPAGHGTATEPSPLTPPTVPKGSGGTDTTTVDTPSMDLFARNMDSLIKPVQDAANLLADVAVAPGAFYHANEIRLKVSGPNGDRGIKENYTKVLNDLANGLADIRNGVQELIKTYSSIEEANGMKAQDLRAAMEASGGDFGAMMTDNGGSVGGTTGTPPGGTTGGG